MNKITAQEANEAMFPDRTYDVEYQNIMSDIYNYIRNKAFIEKSNGVIDISYYRPFDSQEIIAELRRNGFKATEDDDNYSINIDWSLE